VGLLALSVGLHALAMPLAHRDLAAVRDVAQHRTAGLTAMAHGLSWLGRSWVLLALAVIITAVRARRASRLALILVVVGALLLDNLAKALADRSRPPGAHLEHVTSSSFPSGHATQSAAFAVGLCLILAVDGIGRRARALAWVLAAALVVAVAGSRVYLGVHYPTDVIAGIVLGGAWGAVAIAILRASALPRLGVG
jgi:undecaprenyl-diphosphatase